MSLVSDLISQRDFREKGRALLRRQKDADVAIASSFAVLGAIASQQGASPLISDPRLLPTADRLVCWHKAEEGITLSATSKSIGGAPTLNLSGSLNQNLPLRLEIDGAGSLGVATFRWARNELGADQPLTTSPNWVQTGVPTAASVSLGSTGINALFNAGSFVVGHAWVGTVANWTDVDNTAGCAFDNTTVTTSNTCVYEQSSFQFGRSSILFSPGMLGNQATIPSTLNNGAPFHIFALGHVASLPTLANTPVLLAACSQTQTGKDFLDLFMTGPTASPSKVWSLQRSNDSSVVERINSSVLNDLAPHFFEIAFDAVPVGGAAGTLYFWMDGFLVNSRTLTGNFLTNRYCLGAVKLGPNAATLFATWRISDHLLYNAFLSDSDRYPILRSRA